ncbi:MAG: DNA recombination protein RmuC [Minisyncoccia bacterium]|jgi:DNA recombination protein RmuC
MNIAFVIIFLVILIVGFWIILREIQKKSSGSNDDQALLLIQNQINELTHALEAKLGESAKAITDSTNKAFAQATKSAELIKEITQELAKVGEGQRQVASIADNLKSLQDILKNPKQRGVLGEYYLETVLKNVLPPNAYKIQYEFKDGTIVDAVIITKNGLIPIDSKFSLENYNRILESSDKAERERYETAFANDLKTRIDETAKYVKPEEGTLDFAFMFIPSEAVYYDLLVNKVGAIKSNNVDLIEYAAGKKKVMVVSPTTFLAYLQTVLQGLKALRIEETAKKIAERVSELGKHLLSYQEYMQKVGKNLTVTVSAYNSAGKEFGKINKDVYRITGDELNLEAPSIEKPEETT